MHGVPLHGAGRRRLARNSGLRRAGDNRAGGSELGDSLAGLSRGGDLGGDVAVKRKQPPIEIKETSSPQALALSLEQQALLANNACGFCVRMPPDGGSASLLAPSPFSEEAEHKRLRPKDAKRRRQRRVRSHIEGAPPSGASSRGTLSRCAHKSQ